MLQLSKYENITDNNPKKITLIQPFERLNRALHIYKQIIIISILGIILNNYKEVYFRKKKM